MIELLKENFEINKAEFLQKLGSYEGWEVPDAWPKHPSRPNGGYPANSIFFSEAFALYRLANHYKIDMFIESGVYRGGSTSVWGRTLSSIDIFSVDYLQEGRNPRLKWNSVRATLGALYPNITFIEGDGREVLPKLIEDHPDKNIGVFVDGPKNEKGLNLAKKCLDYSNVSFSSLHDYSDDNYFHTKLPEYRELVKDIDLTHPQINKYPDGAGLTILVK